MKKLLVISIVCSLCGFAALASDGGGSDGCGLGWQVTNKKSFLATTTRQSTNSVVPPSFGMSSGTIGCDQHSFAKRDVDAMNYVATNYESLKVEMAEGSGEFLQSFASVMGCTDSAAFGKMTQKNYRTIVGEGNSSTAIFNNVKSELKKNNVGNCNII
jgi:hypothetical protein